MGGIGFDGGGGFEINRRIMGTLPPCSPPPPLWETLVIGGTSSTVTVDRPSSGGDGAYQSIPYKVKSS